MMRFCVALRYFVLCLARCILCVHVMPYPTANSSLITLFFFSRPPFIPLFSLSPFLSQCMHATLCVSPWIVLVALVFLVVFRLTPFAFLFVRFLCPVLSTLVKSCSRVLSCRHPCPFPFLVVIFFCFWGRTRVVSGWEIINAWPSIRYSWTSSFFLSFFLAFSSRVPTPTAQWQMVCIFWSTYTVLQEHNPKKNRDDPRSLRQKKGRECIIRRREWKRETCGRIQKDWVRESTWMREWAQQ